MRLAFSAPVDPATEARPSVSVRRLLLDSGELLSWIRRHHRELLASDARIGQAQAELAQSRLLPNPSLGLSLSDVTVGGTNPAGLRFRDTSIYTLTVSETVELGKRGPRLESARLRLGAERASYLDILADKIAEARHALARVAYVKNKQSVFEESLSSARQLLELQRLRMEKGDLSGNDFDRLLVDTVVLESELAQNRFEYKSALMSCQAVLYATCDPEGTDLSLLSAAAGVSETEEVWEALLARRPDLRALQLRQESALQDALLARRRLIPDPNLTVGYTHDSLIISGDQPNTLLFAMSLPLPVFDRGRRDAARAELRAHELKETAGALRERSRAAIASLAERRSSLEATLGALEKEALPRSRSVLEATTSALNQGELSMTDLLLARRSHRDLVLKVMDLEFGAFAVSNDLRRELGLDVEKARQEEGNP